MAQFQVSITGPNMKRVAADYFEFTDGVCYFLKNAVEAGRGVKEEGYTIVAAIPVQHLLFVEKVEDTPGE